MLFLTFLLTLFFCIICLISFILNITFSCIHFLILVIIFISYFFNPFSFYYFISYYNFTFTHIPSLFLSLSLFLFVSHVSTSLPFAALQFTEWAQLESLKSHLFCAQRQLNGPKLHRKHSFSHKHAFNSKLFIIKTGPNFFS